MSQKPTIEEIQEITNKVLKSYTELNTIKGEKPWGYREYTEGFVGDVGDLMKLIMAHGAYRSSGVQNTKDAISHELSDCLWSILAIANELDIDLFEEYKKNITKLDTYVQGVITRKLDEKASME